MSFTNYSHGLTWTNAGVVATGTSNQYLPTRTMLGARWLVIPLNFADGTGTVTTNVTLPANTIIMPYPFLNVRTAEATGATKTISVGVTGTNGAFISGLSVSTTGFKAPVLTFGAVTMGSKLQVNSATGSTAPVPAPDIEATAIAITWAPGSTDWANFDGDVLLPIYQYADMTNKPINTVIGDVDNGG